MKKSARKKATPIKEMLRPESKIEPLVKDGLGAVESSHRNYIDSNIRSDFDDSLELDEAMRVGHEQESRWDYLLGHRQSREVLAFEPHSAKDDEISVVIRKKQAAIEQLRPHVRPGSRIGAWFWVASGRVQFAKTESAMRRLEQNGITFVGKKLLSKHLPGGVSGKK